MGHCALGPWHGIGDGWNQGSQPPGGLTAEALPCGTLEAGASAGVRLFQALFEVINGALHRLHGRLVPGEAADAPADTCKPSSLTASCRMEGRAREVA